MITNLTKSSLLRLRLRGAGRFWSRAAFFVSCLVFAVGCGKANSSDDGRSRYLFKDEVALHNAVKDFTVTCGGSSCPPSSGTLLVLSGQQLEVCSFGLVGEQTLLTNRHCIPPDLAQKGASCRGRIYAVFVGEDSVQHRFACEEVLNVPEEYQDSRADQRDFAFLRLSKSPNRPVLPIDSSGLKNEEVLHVMASSPLSGSQYGAVLETKTCRVTMNTSVLDSFTSPLKSVAAFRDCQTVRGNSGSPMISQAGSVKAVLSAYFDASTMKKEAAKGMLSRKIIDLLGRRQFSVGTNAACFDEPSLGLQSEGSGCQRSVRDADDGYRPQLSLFDLETMKERGQARALQAEKEIPGFKFEAQFVHPISQDALQGRMLEVEISPKCFKTSPLAGQRWKSSVKRVHLNVDLNSEGRYVGRPVVVSEKIFMTSLGGGQFTVQRRLSDSLPMRQKNLKLSQCDP